MMKKWFEDSKKTSGKETVKIIVGCKSDLEEKREVNVKEAEQYAESVGLKYFETSSKENINVQETFMNLVAEIETRVSQHSSSPQEKEKLTLEKSEKKSKCF